MASPESLSDSELRSKLAEYGFPVGPVTETTRKILVKKLKLLMGYSGRSSNASVLGRRQSSSQFSSGEEDSENEDIKAHLNSSMPPPSSNFRVQRRKTPGRASETPVTQNRTGRRREISFQSDLFVAPKASTPDSELMKKRPPPCFPDSLNRSSSSFSNSSARHLSSRSTVSSSFNDGFDTGSDSDIDSKNWKSNAGQVSSGSTESIPYSSFLSRLFSVKPKQSDTSGPDSSSVNRLLGCRKSFPPSSAVKRPESWGTTRPPNPPFQSNFVKRLSSSTVGCRGTSPPSIYDVKENDTPASNSPNGSLFTPSTSWSGVTSQSDLSQEFKTTQDDAKFVSVILLIVTALFFTILAIIYVNVKSRDRVSFELEDKANNFPVCKPDVGWNKITKELCIEPEELMPAVKLVKVVHPMLIEWAINEKCYGGRSPLMTHTEIVQMLMKDNKSNERGVALENHVMALKILLLANTHWGISVVETAPVDIMLPVNKINLVSIGALVVKVPDLPLICQMKRKLEGVFHNLMIGCLGLALLYSTKLVIQWYIRRRERDKVEVYNMVEKIIELLVHQYNTCPTKLPFVALTHVRDQIISPRHRRSKDRIWKKAVRWLNANESRIRMEMQNIAEEEYPVWRWVPHGLTVKKSSLSEPASRCNNKVWQGQAFDMMTGSPNSLPCSPTPCLKIWHMFDLDMEYGEEWPVRVQDAVLEKCDEEGVAVFHISVDRASREGCVYLKCASQDDAGRAYQALHGWLFDNKLVTVNYPRLERYHERFPEAESAIEPLCPSNNQKLSLQWQNPSEVN